MPEASFQIRDALSDLSLLPFFYFLGPVRVGNKSPANCDEISLALLKNLLYHLRCSYLSDCLYRDLNRFLNCCRQIMHASLPKGHGGGDGPS